MKPFTASEVAAVFSAYPPAIRRLMLSLRRLILDTAAKTPASEETAVFLWAELGPR